MDNMLAAGCIPVTPMARLKPAGLFARVISWLCLAGTLLSCIGCPVLADTSEGVEKIAKIKSLYETAGLAKTTHEIFNRRIGIMEKRLQDQLADSLVKQEKIPRAQANELAARQCSAIMDKFRKRLPATINVDRDSELAFTMAMDKQLSLDELTFLLGFYESPTGKRSSALMSEMVIAGQDAARTQIMPYIQKLAQEANGGTPAGAFHPNDYKSEIQAIPPERVESIRRIMASVRLSEMLRDLWKQSDQREHDKAVADLQADKGLSKEERARMLESLQRFSSLTNTRINWSLALEPPLILKINQVFSDDELKDLVAFYEDPREKSASQKLAATTNETQGILMQLWSGKIDQLFGQIVSEPN